MTDTISTGYTPPIPARQRAANEAAAIRAILAEQPGNPYWQTRLAVAEDAETQAALNDILAALGKLTFVRCRALILALLSVYDYDAWHLVVTSRWAELCRNVRQHRESHK